MAFSIKFNPSSFVNGCLFKFVVEEVLEEELVVLVIRCIPKEAVHALFYLLQRLGVVRTSCSAENLDKV